MAKKTTPAKKQPGALTAEQAEALFAKVDETGHSNEEIAIRERERRRQTGTAVEVDPLSGNDPSGSTIEATITKTAVAVVLIGVIVVVVSQLIYSAVRRSATSNLSQDVNVRTVASALGGGVEWGNGFTTFPDDYSVQEADENTGRVEVSVVDTTSENSLEAFAGSQIQATAFSINALLNPNINTVIYHVYVHVDAEGKLQTSQFFGFWKPDGELKPFMTFVWTKTQSTDGVNFNCTITGVDAAMQERLRDKITTSFTPVQFLGIGNTDSDAASSGEDSGPSEVDDGSSTTTTTTTTETTQTSVPVASGTDLTTTDPTVEHPAI